MVNTSFSYTELSENRGMFIVIVYFADPADTWVSTEYPSINLSWWIHLKLSSNLFVLSKVDRFHYPSIEFTQVCTMQWGGECHEWLSLPLQCRRCTHVR